MIIEIPNPNYYDRYCLYNKTNICCCIFDIFPSCELWKYTQFMVLTLSPTETGDTAVKDILSCSILYRKTVINGSKQPFYLKGGQLTGCSQTVWHCLLRSTDCCWPACVPTEGHGARRPLTGVGALGRGAGQRVWPGRLYVFHFAQVQRWRRQGHTPQVGQRRP